MSSTAAPASTGRRQWKAFNTNFAATLASVAVGDLPTTVLITGDDDDAKSVLGEIVGAGGLRTIDAGSLARARELEALGFLQITLAAAEDGWLLGTYQPSGCGEPVRPLVLIEGL